MPLSAAHDENVARLMELLRGDDNPSAVQLREELAYLLFYGDPTWASNTDASSISDYREILAGWFADDSSSEYEFINLTTSGSEPDNARAELVSWFAPVVEQWKQWAKTTEGDVEKGIPNPRYETDQTPGTQFYWYDPDNEVYLYASTSDAPDAEWLSYEERRYTPVAYDDVRKTNFRQDVVTKAYEYQSRDRSGRWLTQAEWEQEARAAGDGADAGDEAAEPLYTVPAYDAGFQMYRRFNSVRREYEYADDPTAATWLNVSEATAKMASRKSAADAGGQQDVAGKEAQAAAGRVAGDAATQLGLAAIRELAANGGISLAGMPAEELVALTADVLAQRIAAAELPG